MKEKRRLKSIYYGMKQRCYNQNGINYKYYGGEGIFICDEWLNDFEKFYEWSLQNGYSDNLTIDRIDSNKEYRSEEHTSELQSRFDLVCCLLLEKKTIKK